MTAERVSEAAPSAVLGEIIFRKAGWPPPRGFATPFPAEARRQLSSRILKMEESRLIVVIVQGGG